MQEVTQEPKPPRPLMSVPPQSMPPVSQYAPKPTVAGHSDSTSTTTAPASNAMSTSTASSAPVSQTATTTSSSAMTATSANAATATAADPTTTTQSAGGGIPGTTVGAAPDWRDKDADRGARQQIARIILTLIMKSANRPTSANYNPREIARRLEHTLYMGAPSKQEYSNVQTLKARLQQALDNSRRRQMQQQQARLLQQQQQLQASGVPADAAQQQAQAQLLQQRQMALLQRQQQQQMAAALHNQRANFQAVPFPGASAAMSQPASVNQPLQMPLSMSQMGVKTPGPIASVSSTPATTALSPANGATNSILDELDREADEMANGVKDQPLSMPESELQPATTPTGAAVAGNPASAASFVNATPTAASPTVAANAGSGSFNAIPLSMPPDISVSSAAASSGGLVQPTPSMISAASAGAGGTNMYHGMNLTGPQLQQIQQIQQMQQLRRMQQLQQLQQQQLNGKVSAAQLQAGAAVPTSGVSTTPAPATGNGGSPGMIQMNEVSIAQKREELKRRLIQLKHARTCTTGECAIDYCSRTKALLSHVSRCANAQCTTLGCKSTRQLLSHFRKCRNLQCDVCSAIRPPMNENEQQLVLRRQQERLCMLRHASTCTAQQCILPYCAGMKVLWKHICECHQRQCRTDHCISSRYVLSHFKQCNKMICEVCGPVRKAIKVIDSCRGNPTQLQLAASQCPEGVRGLIKIMNTTTAAVPGASANAGNGSAQQAHVKAEGGAAANGGAKVAGTKESSLLEEMKKKPLKLQTEKEKKLRRKEQAKIAKARAQAKAAAAAAAALTGPVSALKGAAQPVMHNGLVVRGTQAELRGDHHASHQDISFLDSMTEGQLDEHIRSLRFNFCGHISIGELKSRLMPLLQKLMDSEYGWTFNNPVDPVQWNIPDYFDIIKCPMDLGTIKKRLENEHYNSVEAFAGDVRLVFENCIAYNSSTNKFNIAAKQLLASFNKSLAALKNQLEKQLFKRCEQRREEMCQLCGGDSFKFAPCMLFCSGPCAGRIRRHTHYYSDPRGEHHWCSSCYKQMKDGPIDMSLLPQLSSAATEVAPPPGAGLPFDGVLKKSSLIKRKNSEVAEEPWVECDSCKLWYHQICALFNERNHAISGEQEPFVCPICVKKQRAAGVKPSMDNGLKAKRLPITRMAKLIETRVMEAIEKAGEDEAVRMGSMGNSDSIGFSNGTKESASDTQFGITIREVLSIDKQVQVKPRMGKLLSGKYDKPKKGGSGATGGEAGQTKSLKRPRSTGSAADKKAAAAASASSSLSLQLTYRSRCICVFQELDGVDVLIFTLYVQEYGPDSLSPNAGRVYVSYLDSVNYFQPKKLRTLMHQQVMLGFLEDCKNRGFHTCHIWSCPPLKGDDYIFFCKPENQKIPKSARLRQWYQKLLVQAKHDGLVVNISNLYAEYYLKKKAAHELPYFEGDYWPRLAEDLIKQLEEKDSGNRAKTDATNAGDIAPNGSSASGANTPANAPQTPISRSPSPAESNNENGSVAVDSKASTSKKGAMTLNASSKSKSKRSKKGGFATEPSVTRSSASKARSKKGGKSSRPSSSSKNVVNNDPLMQKLKGILEPQKEDFFVVDLYPKCHKCGVPIVHEGYWELKTVPPPASVNNLLEAAKKTRSSSSSSRNSPPRHYHYFYCGSCYETNKTQLLHRVEVSGNCAKRAKELSERILPLNEKAAAAELAELDLQEIKFEAALKFVDPMQEEEEEVQVKQEGDVDSGKKDDVKTENPDKVKENGASEAVAGSTDTKEASDKPAGESAADASADAAPATEKPSASPSAKETQSEEGKSDDKAEEQSTEAKDTKTETVVVKKVKRCIGDDLDDVIMPCEIFDTREAFLLYCQNNHCQFDQIRRAKHSSMMVLYHLFNQGTTGFTFSCSNCKTTLLSGNRWNCSICPVFNLCDSCHTKTKHEHQLHLFKVVSIPRTDNEVANETVSTKVKGVVSKAGGVTGRAIKREAGSADLKRAKHAKHVKAAAQKAGGSRKRKLHQSSPVATTAASPPESAMTPDAAPATASDGVPASAAATPTAATSGSNGSTSDGDAAKKRRIHNIDPQLLLQLEHASSCTVPNCTFFNCNRMQAMLKHGAICEQRLAGPCVLCKRIIGLLSAHARQCTKDYAVCKVPRCADIRRHFLAQVQARQQQLQRARELQAQEAASGAAATTDAANATQAAPATEKTEPTP
ncbi:Histone acetyltransferase [Phytophthora citrophthora]|uniref:histone acetyltransferase n=1 Tax=Phytophthora citrophthora TaxID=4793 RepID=A0AAD9GKZ7_9STRA|nr:Histone acetyltransferase [Phytophthora citrophthora]